MTVAELIKALEEMPQEMEVAAIYDGFLDRFGRAHVTTPREELDPICWEGREKPDQPFVLLT